MKIYKHLKLNNHVPDTRRISKPAEKQQDSAVVKRAVKQKIRNLAKRKFGK